MNERLFAEYRNLLSRAIMNDDAENIRHYAPIVLQMCDEKIMELRRMCGSAMRNGDSGKVREINNEISTLIEARETIERNCGKLASVTAPPHLRCPVCSSGTLQAIGERKGGFSGGKAVAGAVLAGPLGLAAGALGKKLVTYRCSSCGYTCEK